MSDLLWPGDHRAGEVFSDAGVLAAMVRVEEVWLAALVAHDLAPPDAALGVGRLARALGPEDLGVVAERAEESGTPVVALVDLLRERLNDAGEVTASRWLHRGLTSQDVLDTALVLESRAALRWVRVDIDAQVGLLTALAREHRDSVMVARTLTQYAVPTTFGLKAAGWLDGLLEAAEELDGLRLSAQLGGAAGTMAGLVELARSAQATDSGGPADSDAAAQEQALACWRTVLTELGLDGERPWHTRRRALTRLVDVLVSCTDVWGHLAADVLLLGRPEVGELLEGSSGTSSTMPHKANPVRAVLLRRTALAAPAAAATMHAAAAAQVDERADGAWHAEWAVLRDVARHTVTGASHATALLAGLEVRTDRMRARVEESAHDLTSEQRSLAAPRAPSEQASGPGSRDPASYVGLAGVLVDRALERAARHVGSRAQEQR